MNCSDVDECGEGGHNCHDNARCTNMIGSFICSCKTGFSGNGTHCKEIFQSNRSAISPNVIIGIVFAVVVIVATVIIIAYRLACKRKRKRKPVNTETEDVDAIPNPVFQDPIFHSSTNMSHLAQKPNSESEQPSLYAQLDSLGRTSSDANYQALNVDNNHEIVV